MPRKLTAETTIACEPEALWRMTQEPFQHVRWDLRFTSIEGLSDDYNGRPRRFRYATRIGMGMEVAGWGESAAHREGRSSALRFGSDDWKSLILEGDGCWIYSEPAPGRSRLFTVYDYRTRHGLAGRMADLLFRPLMVWATRWSFDRLRLWIETGTNPETLFRLWSTKVLLRVALGGIWILEGILPKILAVSPAEVDLVRRSGVWAGSPEGTLFALGVAEVIAGLVLLIGWAERPMVLLSTLAMAVLTFLVLVNDPAAWADPYGGLVKNLALAAQAAAIWILVPHVPDAGRARPTRRPNGEA